MHHPILRSLERSTLGTTNKAYMAMDSVPIQCPIWGTPCTVFPSGRRHFHGIDSARTGGKYLIGQNLAGNLLAHDLDADTKAKLTTWLVDQRRWDKNPPLVTREVIEEARAARRISVPDRADRVLRCLAQKLKDKEPGTLLAADDHADEPHWTGEDGPGKTYLELLAYLESPEPTGGGLYPILQELEVEGLIGKLPLRGWSVGTVPPPLRLTVTVPGFRRANELAQDVTMASDRVFVAMWLHESTDRVWEKGIKPAIRAAGYEPVLIRDQQYTGPIVARIISEIRRSSFIVVDYTHGRGGARGSVYYEAGFAHGLGKEVISTCRNTVLKKVHFDTQQHNHIVWEKGKEEELEPELRDCITALMGDGPKKARKVREGD